jgi:heme/copper-type cytochrome/quinol oxidase subunit 2
MQSTGARIGIAVAAVAAVVVLFIVLSGGDDDESTTTADTTAEAQQAGKPAEEGKPAKKPKSKPEETATEIQVQGGQPVGGVAKIEATVDEPVRIVVSSPDTTEEVHVHGYDVFADLSPQKPAKLDFDASIEGVFEIELEHSAVHIAELTVEP